MDLVPHLETGMAVTKIIERNAHAVRAQIAQRMRQARRVFHHVALGHLNGDAGRVQAAVDNGGQHVIRS